MQGSAGGTRRPAPSLLNRRRRKRRSSEPARRPAPPRCRPPRSRHSSLGVLSPIEYELSHGDNLAHDQALTRETRGNTGESTKSRGAVKDLEHDTDVAAISNRLNQLQLVTRDACCLATSSR